MASTVFLFVGGHIRLLGSARAQLSSQVAILDAGRNALSFFMLLVVSLGLSVVRESLGKTMLKCQLLAGAHFIFGGASFRVPESPTHGRSSIICCWYCRTRVGVNFSVGPLVVHHTIGVYTERLPHVDPIFSQW